MSEDVGQRMFVERICTGYIMLMRTLAAKHRSRLSDVLPDAQLRAEYDREYCILVGESDFSLPVSGVNSD